MWCCAGAGHYAFTVLQPTDRVYINSITELCSLVNCIKDRGVFSPLCESVFPPACMAGST